MRLCSFSLLLRLLMPPTHTTHNMRTRTQTTTSPLKNEDWDDVYGGHLELWDRNMSNCARRILPEFNRLVVFSTTDYSYHGHPDPLNCPPGRARISIAQYYYSAGRPAAERSGTHSTTYKKRPTHGDEVDHQWPEEFPAQFGGTASAL